MFSGRWCRVRCCGRGSLGSRVRLVLARLAAGAEKINSDQSGNLKEHQKSICLVYHEGQNETRVSRSTLDRSLAEINPSAKKTKDRAEGAVPQSSLFL